MMECTGCELCANDPVLALLDSLIDALEGETDDERIARLDREADDERIRRDERAEVTSGLRATSGTLR